MDLLTCFLQTNICHLLETCACSLGMNGAPRTKFAFLLPSLLGRINLYKFSIPQMFSSLRVHSRLFSRLLRSRASSKFEIKDLKVASVMPQSHYAGIKLKQQLVRSPQ